MTKDKKTDLGPEGQPTLKSADPFDLSNIAVASVTAEDLGVEKPILMVPVDKPSRQDFFRTHPDPEFRIEARVLKLEAERETYLVTCDVWPSIPGETKLVRLVPYLARSGGIGLWPVSLPDDLLGKRDTAWGVTARKAAEIAESKWVRMQANMAARALRHRHFGQDTGPCVARNHTARNPQNRLRRWAPDRPAGPSGCPPASGGLRHVRRRETGRARWGAAAFSQKSGWRTSSSWPDEGERPRPVCLVAEEFWSGPANPPLGGGASSSWTRPRSEHRTERVLCRVFRQRGTGLLPRPGLALADKTRWTCLPSTGC